MPSRSASSTCSSASVSGRDIYAVTAPLVVEAAFRILTGAGNTAGAASVGARFDAKDFLSSPRNTSPSGDAGRQRQRWPHADASSMRSTHCARQAGGSNGSA
jgi:hypothetical protein